MTYFKQVALLLALLPALALTSCEQNTATTAETPAATDVPATTAPADGESLPTATAAYICPMNCEGSASDQPGKCPVCGMELEPNPAAQPAPTI